MSCPDHHCCKGGCYNYCNVVVCHNQGYNSDCRIPVGQVDCLDVVEYSGPSCNNEDTVQVDDGILHVRNKCRVTFKICSGPGFMEESFPDVPVHMVPGHNVPKTQLNKRPNITTPTTSIVVPQNIITDRQTVNINDKSDRDGLHTHFTKNMSDGKVMGEDVAIGIGIGVGIAVMALVAGILCRCYYLKRKKANKPPIPENTTVQQIGTDNPMYAVDSAAPSVRDSCVSHRYEEVRSITDSDNVSRTFSEPKYESIKSNPVKFRIGSNYCEVPRGTSEHSNVYQTVIDDISSKQNLVRKGSDVIYSSYFKEGISSNSNSSTHYFILEAEESETQVKEAHLNRTEHEMDNNKEENMYYVLEKSAKTNENLDENTNVQS